MNELLHACFQAVLALIVSPLLIVSYFLESKIKGAIVGLIQGIGVSFYALVEDGRVENWHFIYSIFCALIGFMLGSVSENKAMNRKRELKEYYEKRKEQSEDEHKNSMRR